MENSEKKSFWGKIFKKNDSLNKKSNSPKDEMGKRVIYRLKKLKELEEK